MQQSSSEPFWKRKKFSQMTPEEWESLCDGCGKCCCIRLEDVDSGHIYRTDISCQLFDTQTCQCRDYANRQKKVTDCVRLTPENVRTLTWLPRSCAYRRLDEGKGLPACHHLVSGSCETIHMQGHSVRGTTINERKIKIRDYLRHIVNEPDVPLD